MFEGIHYLAVEGVIGAGKTSLVEILSRIYSTGKLLEPYVENPFLSPFYKDRNQFAFQTQLWFLLSRFKQTTDNLKQQDLFHRTIISDFLFAKDAIFANLNLDENELALYNRISETLEKEVPRPDFVIYLQASTDVLLERIAERGRPFERNIDREYIHGLNEAYNHFFFHYEDSPVLIVDTNHVHLTQNMEELDEVVAQIAVHFKKGGTTYYHPLGKEGIKTLSAHNPV